MTTDWVLQNSLCLTYHVWQLLHTSVQSFHLFPYAACILQHTPTRYRHFLRPVFHYCQTALADRNAKKLFQHSGICRRRLCQIVLPFGDGISRYAYRLGQFVLGQIRLLAFPFDHFTNGVLIPVNFRSLPFLFMPNTYTRIILGATIASIISHRTFITINFRKM